MSCYEQYLKRVELLKEADLAIWAEAWGRFGNAVSKISFAQRAVAWNQP